MRTTGLPTTLTISGQEFEINTDFRYIIETICFAYNDPEIPPEYAGYILVYNLFKCDIEELPDYSEALKQACWFVDGGREYNDQSKNSPRLFDWEQDYDFIISAVDQNVKTAETVLELDYMHWWTFLRKFSERKETRLDNIIGIREKLAKHEKLEKWEQRTLEENRSIIELRDSETDELEKELWR